MNEVKKCSISGISFTLDNDAYEALDAYLKSLRETYKDTPDGAEIVADIEARIVELILSVQDNTRVVGLPLIRNIIGQLGSAEDISGEDPDSDLHSESPRIPRRLYRDMENAKLGGVCAGIGKYFDVDPVWVRLGMFAPLLLCIMGNIRLFWWMSSLFGNLFGIFIVCYLIMWFAVPVARSARQKLEMTGERITAEAIRDTTAAASDDADVAARPIVAEAVSVFGRVVLILLKLFAGLIVFGAIMLACALIIGIFALIVGGSSLPEFSGLEFSVWLPVLAIVAVLIPVLLLIYTFMCLIASRKPGAKTVVVIFILWFLAAIALGCVAIREHLHEQIGERIESNIERRTEAIDEALGAVDEAMEALDEALEQSGQNGIDISVRPRERGGDVTISAGSEPVVTVSADERADGADVSIRVAEPRRDTTAVQ